MPTPIPAGGMSIVSLEIIIRQLQIMTKKVCNDAFDLSIWLSLSILRATLPGCLYPGVCGA